MKDRQKERDDIRDRIFKDEGIVWSDRSQKMFDIAWQEGHASGEYDVLNWVRTLKELLPEGNCCDECYVSYCSDGACECHKKI